VPARRSKTSVLAPVSWWAKDLTTPSRTSALELDLLSRTSVLELDLPWRT
jgi:hypothetical protein